MSSPEIEQIKDMMQRLETTVQQKEKSSAIQIEQQTEALSQKIEALIQAMEKGEVTLSKNEMILLISSYKNMTSIVSGEIDEAKKVLKHNAQAANMRKSYGDNS